MRVPAAVRTVLDVPTRLSLRASLLLLLSGMAALIIVHGVNEAVQSRADEIGRAQEQLVEFADAVTQRQNDVVTEVRALLQVLTDVPSGLLGSSENCRFTLQRAVKELPSVRSITIFSTNGAAICSSQDTLPTARVADRDYFLGAIATGSFVLSDYVISRVTKKPAVIAAMPRTEGDEVTSVFAAALDLEWLNRIVAQRGRPPGSRALLVDSVGTVLAAYPDAAQWVGKNLKKEAQFRRILNATASVTETVDASGVRWIAVSKALAGTRARVLVQQPRAIVLAQASREALTHFALILAFVAVSFAAVWLGGERFVVQPMRALIKTAEAIGGGDRAARVATEGLPKDLKALSLAFNKMAADLEKHDAELNAANAKLRELAATDGLTGLANRRRFDETFEAEWSRAIRDFKSLAVIFIDVDNFKKFNDRYGHIAGDGCLRAVAQIIGQCTRRPGDLAGRTGGEEFALLLPGSNPQHASGVAEELRKSIAGLGIEHQDNPAGVVTVSIGVAATTPARGQRSTILLEWADQALYSAKGSGRNRVVQARTGLSIAS